MPRQNNMDNPDPKNLQAGIIKRFLPEQEYQAFLTNYRSHRRGLGSTRDRALNLARTLSEQEMEMVRFYMNDTSTPLSEKAKEMGLSNGAFYARSMRACLRYLFQNKELSGL